MTLNVLSMRQYFDLVIVGGSFCGLLLANALKNKNLNIAVIEKNKTVIRENLNKRSTAVSAGNLDFLFKIGLQKDILEQAGKIKNIRIKEENSTYPINYSNPHHPMCYVFDNNFLLQKLLENLHNSSIKIFFDTNFQQIDINNHWINIKCEDECEIETPFLIAADGKFSNIRKYFHIPLHEKHYKQKVLVFNIKHEKSHEENALELFTNQGPLALLPTIDQKQSSVIWTFDEEHAASYVNFDKTIIADLLAETINHYLGKIDINSEIISYPLSLSYIKQYFHKRILFMGDALHSIHPIAGQGFNLTIQDIQTIKKIIDEHYMLGYDLGSEFVLQKFVKARKFKNWQMIQITDKLNTLYRNQNQGLQIIKNFGSFVINNSEFLKRKIINYAMQIPH